MKRNGSMIAHGRRWLLYERQEVVDGRVVMVLSQPSKDRIEKEKLDEIEFKRYVSLHTLTR